MCCRRGCVGFEKLHYKDHILKATEEKGLWEVLTGKGERESQFQLRVQNGAGETLHIKAMDVEYPEGVHVTWSETGYDCDVFNKPSNVLSGCKLQNVSEAEVTTLKVEDVGRGSVDLRYGSVYRAKVKVTFDVHNALKDHTETAICSGKIE